MIEFALNDIDFSLKNQIAQNNIVIIENRYSQKQKKLDSFINENDENVIINAVPDNNSQTEQENNEFFVIENDLSQKEILIKNINENDIEFDEEIEESKLEIYDRDILKKPTIPTNPQYFFFINEKTGEIISRRRLLDKNGKIIYHDSVVVPKTHAKNKKNLK